MTSSVNNKPDHHSIYKLTSLDTTILTALGQDTQVMDMEPQKSTGLDEYREHIRQLIRDEVRKTLEVEMQKASQELQEEQRKAIKSILDDHKSAIRQVVEEEKASIKEKADLLRQSIMKLGM